MPPLKGDWIPLSPMLDALSVYRCTSVRCWVFSLVVSHKSTIFLILCCDPPSPSSTTLTHFTTLSALTLECYDLTEFFFARHIRACVRLRVCVCVCACVRARARVYVRLCVHNACIRRLTNILSSLIHS